MIIIETSDSERKPLSLKALMTEAQETYATRRLEIRVKKIAAPAEEAWFQKPNYQASLWMIGAVNGPIRLIHIQGEQIPDVMYSLMQELPRLSNFARLHEQGIFKSANPSEPTKKLLRSCALIEALGWTQHEVYAWFGETPPSDIPQESSSSSVVPALIRRRP